MSGPTTSKPTLPDVQAAAGAGAYTELTLVFVLDIGAWAVVIPEAEPIVYLTQYPDLATYQTEFDVQPTVEFPGVVSTVDPTNSTFYTPTECGPTRSGLSGLLGGGFRPMPASSISGGNVNADSDAFDPADLIDVRYSI